MRALPAVSLEYFGSTAVGKTAGPDGAAGAAAGAASFLASFGAAAGAVAGAAAGAAAASAPQLALRKSFHFWPASVPAALAAWYLALHSCVVRACAGDIAANTANPDTAIAQSIFA